METQAGGNPDNPEDIKLFLPSSLTADTASCSHHLLAIEWELRIAQAGDALDEIRQSLRLRDYMYTFKRNWIRGQSANTRAQNALGRVEARAAAAAEKYRAAHAAFTGYRQKDISTWLIVLKVRYIIKSSYPLWNTSILYSYQSASLPNGINGSRKGGR
jgi:hypothetical protein